MKKSAFTAIAAGVAICILSIALAQCNPATKGDESSTNATEAAPITEVATPQPDSAAVSQPTPTTPETATPAPPPAKVDEPPAPSKAKDTKPVATKTSAPKTPTAPKPKPATIPKPTPAPKAESPAPPTEAPKTTSPPVTPAPKPEKAPSSKAAAMSTAAFGYKSVKAVIHGTSTLHEWDSQVTKIEGKGSMQSKDNVVVALKDVEIKMEVKGIKSKEGKKMDDKTFETFHSDKNPYITYAFSSAQVKIDASNAVTIETSGNLSMAGVTNAVNLTATGKVLPNGDLQLSVSKKIKMTDYKMEPPVMMLGTIKVGNEITVSFDFVLTKK